MVNEALMVARAGETKREFRFMVIARRAPTSRLQDFIAIELSAGRKGGIYTFQVRQLSSTLDLISNFVESYLFCAANSSVRP